MTRSPAITTPIVETSEDGVLELATLLGSVVRNLKQRADPPPKAFREAFEANSLGPRHMPVMIAVALGDARYFVNPLVGLLRMLFDVGLRLLLQVIELAH